ncbi:MAG: glycosyltransferase [Alphaproteobacteria bacterium]|nr:glycosyltransferase [Alphaproteobacteria bacterium]
MDIVIADDSLPFDGTTPLNQPLGGAEKAIAGLAGALAGRGHHVTVLNHTAKVVDHAGVAWRPLEDDRPGACDLLVASRRPDLLDVVGQARHRALWLAGDAGYLGQGPHAEAFGRHPGAHLVFGGEPHRATWTGDAERCVVIPPGVAACYREAGAMTPYHPPRAVVTTHPRMGLEGLVRLWARAIAPRAPLAELLVFSGALSAAADGAEVPADLAGVFNAARAAAADGVHLVRPLADPDMADVYRTARVHLYPGHEKEVYAATLADSQAVGLPAVARKRGAVPERVRDGRSGYLAPDDEAFANCAVLLLNDDSVFTTRSRDCRNFQRSRGWDEAAAAFEALAA